MYILKEILMFFVLQISRKKTCMRCRVLMNELNEVKWQLVKTSQNFRQWLTNH